MAERLFFLEREEERSPKICRMTCYEALTPEGFTEGAMVRIGLVMVGNNWNLAFAIACLSDNCDTIIYQFDDGVQEAAFRRGLRKNVLNFVREIRETRDSFNKT